MPLSPPTPPLLRAARPMARQDVVVALMAIDAALLTAWMVGGSAARTFGAALAVLGSIGATAWQARRAAREAVRETAREAAREAVARAHRELLSGMSHDLRTPLNSVIGFSTVLLRSCEGKMTPQERDYLERVRANGVQLLQVVDVALERSAAKAAEYAAGGEAAPPR